MFALQEQEYEKRTAQEKRKLWGILGAAEVAVLLLTLNISGFQSLLPTLVDSGKFADRCDGYASPGTTDPDSDGLVGCVEQSAALSSMQLFAGFAANGFLVPGGFIHDLLGPKWYGLMGAAVLGGASLGFAFFKGGIQLYVAYALVGVGNTAIFFSLTHLANLVPPRSGTILTVFRISEPFSALVYLLFNQLYQHAGVSLVALFSAFQILPLGYATFCLLFQPNTPYGRRVADTRKKVDDIGGDIQGDPESCSPLLDEEELGEPIEETRKLDERYTSSGLPFKRQIWTPELHSYIAWSLVLVCFAWFFDATANQQLASMHHASTEQVNRGGQVYTIFRIIAPPLTAPMGPVLDRYGSPVGLLGLACIVAVLGTLIYSPPPAVQLYVTYPVYAIYYTATLSIWIHAANVCSGGGTSMGRFMGVNSAFTAVGLLAMIPFSNYVITQSLFPYALFPFLLFMLIVTFLFAFVLKHRARYISTFPNPFSSIAFAPASPE